MRPGEGHRLRANRHRHRGAWWLGLAALGLTFTLALALAALHFGRDTRPVPSTLGTGGIGPFILGESLSGAAAQALPWDAAAAVIGPGCDDRDQVTVVLPVAGRHMTVMAMATPLGTISEIIALPDASDAPHAPRSLCRQRALDLAASLSPYLGTPGTLFERRLPVSDEFHIPFGTQITITGRWFPGGNSCDLSLHYLLVADD